MKKLLIASTALSLAGGAAFAEMAITVSGDAELGVDYNSEAGEGMSKHSFVHEVGIDFSASGTTDGGLSFGGSAGFDTNDDMVNLGTVHVSGSFGTLTIGDNDPGSFIAGGIADIGMNGIGVDDMAENLRKGTASQLRYDNSFGQVSIAISAGTKAGSAAVDRGKGTFYYHVPGDPDKISIGSNFSAYHMDDVVTEGENADKVPMLTSTEDMTAYKNRALAVVNALKIGTFAVGSSVITYDPDSNIDTSNSVNLHQHRYGKADEDGEDTSKVYHDDGSTVTEVKDEKVVAAVRLLHSAYKPNDDGFVEADGSSEIVNPPNPGRAALVAPTKAMAAVSAETEFAFGMNFETGGVTIGLGYDSNKTVSMGAGFSAGEISTNLLYVKMDDDEDTKDMNEEATSMGVDLSYSMGASTVTLAYGRNKPEEGMAMDAVGMGVTHDLGGGATMNAGFGKVDTMVDKKIVSQNKASIGLMFAF